MMPANKRGIRRKKNQRAQSGLRKGKVALFFENTSLTEDCTFTARKIADQAVFTINLIKKNTKKMSWSIYAMGKAPAVSNKVHTDLSKYKMAEPEETLKNKNRRNNCEHSAGVSRKRFC
jgi:hypothetical protein